ncbi:unnamed protein product [Rotaria sp. Silwood2]|nr:unnamed protein product [Rotaria sp. Silwood2]
MIYIRNNLLGGITQSSWFDVRPLVYDPILSGFPPNTSIRMIVKNIMIEQWNPSYSYSRFYESCAPSYCTHSQRTHTKTIIGMMITMLSMIGGLTVSLHLITPYLICSSSFISNEWQISFTSDLVSNLSIYARIDYRRFLSAHLQFLTGLCEHSIQSVNNSIDQFLSSLFVTAQLLPETDFHKRLDLLIEQTLNTISLFSLLVTICQLKFEPISLYPAYLEVDLLPPVVADFNGDHRLDLAFARQVTQCMYMTLGNGNGNFSAQTTFSTGRGSCPRSLAIADFNGDTYKDIAVANLNTRNIGVFLGHGDGTFETQKSSFNRDHFFPIRIAVGDFNEDTRSDVAVSYESESIVGVMFGYGNGTFGTQADSAIETAVITLSAAVSDFNCDGHLDIAIGQNKSHSIGVLLGHGDGNFDKQTIFSSEFNGPYTSMVVGDFNGDGCQDIVAMNSESYSMDILLNTCECCSSETLKTNTFIHQ